MRLVADSEQRFGKWSRRFLLTLTLRLVTMEKIASCGEVGVCDGKLPAHANFRETYFKGKTNIPI
jgi:hypothetical protein